MPQIELKLQNLLLELQVYFCSLCSGFNWLIQKPGTVCFAANENTIDVELIRLIRVGYFFFVAKLYTQPFRYRFATETMTFVGCRRLAPDLLNRHVKFVSRVQNIGISALRPEGSVVGV